MSTWAIFWIAFFGCLCIASVADSVRDVFVAKHKFKNSSDNAKKGH